ncbi:uncharacterized protein T551_00746 [Pneumocystis jirovecii RU7]|uniref:Spt20-like SEP domain-containing protein n=2 Tax=Pneumocystis jirovecii TaxID=42068 RepID=A0A0W4ZUQ5_PNEJ7|nr:uncharacterized protein T551_00746 [Pneumocystis jirovecii RU7]KTW32064.1 hypothetical protein T551_00746 [Pneumocystis jirovecii RU7]
MAGKVNEKTGFKTDQTETKKDGQEKFIQKGLVRTSDELLERYKNEAPSLILHMYPTYFRFDQQEGVFLYNSPMKIILEYIRMETIPPDCMEIFKNAKTRFYEGCLIVQIRDHRQSMADVSHSSGKKTMRLINEHIIPSKSPSKGFPTVNTTEKVYRTVLKPSSETLWEEICIFSESVGGKFSNDMAIKFESQILIATTPILYLLPAANPMVMSRIFSELYEPMVPIVKKRKQSPDKTNEAKKAEEQLMLIMDERQGKNFQPSFSRLAFVEKLRHKRSRTNFNSPQAYQRQHSQNTSFNIPKNDLSLQKMQQRNSALLSSNNAPIMSPMLKNQPGNIYTKEQQEAIRAQKAMLQVRTMQLKQTGMPIHQINEIIRQQAAQMNLNIQEMPSHTEGRMLVLQGLKKHLQNIKSKSL